VAPTAWTPEIFDEGALGTFLGAATFGIDLIGRFSWAAALAIEPSDRRFQGAARLTWAGLGNPVLSVEAERTWEDIGRLRLPDQSLLPVFERGDEVGLFATLVRRRWRSSSSASLGVGRDFRRRDLVGGPDSIRLADAEDALIDLIGRVGYANYRTQPFSISREDGIALSLEAEHSLERDPHPEFDATVTELTAWGAGYRALHPWGFANHVIAIRASALARLQDGAVPTRIGGVSGNVLNALGLPFGSGSLLLPVRGFDRGVRYGTRAWTASAEYRLPIALIGRRPALSPLYLDRISALAFADAGDAWCAGEVIERFAVCGLQDDGTVADPPPLLSAGAELVFDVGFASFLPALVRAGVAFPIQGPGDPVRFHIQLGTSF
jgi:hypothetical protein